MEEKEGTKCNNKNQKYEKQCSNLNAVDVEQLIK
jgi:hypothetical protein